MDGSGRSAPQPGASGVPLPPAAARGSSRCVLLHPRGAEQVPWPGHELFGAASALSRPALSGKLPGTPLCGHNSKKLGLAGGWLGFLRSLNPRAELLQGCLMLLSSLQSNSHVHLETTT